MSLSRCVLGVVALACALLSGACASASRGTADDTMRGEEEPTEQFVASPARQSLAHFGPRIPHDWRGTYDLTGQGRAVWESHILDLTREDEDNFEIEHVQAVLARLMRTSPDAQDVLTAIAAYPEGVVLVEAVPSLGVVVGDDDQFAALFRYEESYQMRSVKSALVVGVTPFGLRTTCGCIPVLWSGESVEAIEQPPDWGGMAFVVGEHFVFAADGNGTIIDGQVMYPSSLDNVDWSVANCETVTLTRTRHLEFIQKEKGHIHMSERLLGWEAWDELQRARYAVYEAR